MPANARDHIQPRITLSTSFTEIIATQHGVAVEIRQLPSETQQILHVRHRTATDPADETEQIPAGGSMIKRGYRARTGRDRGIRIGDTIGFVAATSATPILQIKIFEE